MPAKPNFYPDDDPGFEVVNNPPPKPKVTPARPVAARPAPKKIVAEDPGFEVVDAPPPKKKPKVQVVDDDEPRPKKPKVQVVDDDEDAPRPRKKRPRRDDDEDEDDERQAVESRIDDGDLESQINDLKPGKKKLTDRDRKRILKEKKRLEREEREKTAEEWLFPSIVFGIGILLTLAAAAIVASQNSFIAIAVVVMMVLTLVECVLMIPFAVGALMLVGKLCGIEYGTLTHTIRSLGAIIAIDTGIYWMGGALASYIPCVAWPVTLVLGFVATYGLFMKFFELDAMEARISIMAINFVTGVGTFLGVIITVIVVAMLVSSARKVKDSDPDDDPDPPGKQQWKQPAGGKWQPPVDDGGDDN